MAKSSRPSLQKQFVDAWMKTRPYDIDSIYDLEYVAVARKVHEVLNANAALFDLMGLQSEDLVPLAVILTAYFEDFINETELWAAFIHFNDEHLGTYLPFYTLTEDYDPDYINPEDISFLIWHWLMVAFEGKKMVSPLAEPILDLGHALMVLLEDKIDEMSATDAVLDFLLIKDDAGLLDVRRIMEWVAKHSYLFGHLGFEPLITPMLQAQAKAIFESGDFAQAELKLYDLEMELLFKLRCGLGGLRPCDWTARIAICSPEIEQHILGLTTRMVGYFEFLDQTDKQYRLAHLATGRIVQVPVASTEFYMKPGDCCYAPFVLWKGEFWVSGMVSSGYRRAEIDPARLETTIPDQLLLLTDRAQWLYVTRDIEKRFTALYGGHVAVFPDAKAAFQAQAQVVGAAMDDWKFADSLQTMPAALSDFHSDGPTALICITGQGLAFCSVTPKIIDYLSAPTAAPDQRNMMTSTAFRFLHPVAIAHIFRHYPTDRLGWAGIPIDMAREWRFLSAYFNPDQAGPPTPALQQIGRRGPTIL